MQEYVADLCVEDGKGLCRVQRDENPNQELLVFSFQGKSEAVYDAGEEKKQCFHHQIKNREMLYIIVTSIHLENLKSCDFDCTKSAPDE